MDLSKYWKTIFETIQDGIMVVDDKGKIVAVNPAAESLTGYTSDELVGKSCRTLDCTGCKIIGRGRAEKWCGLFAKGNVRTKKCTITDKGNRKVTIIKKATILKNELGQTIGAVESLRDMSDVVRQQEEILNLKKSLHLDEGYKGLIGSSPPMRSLFELIQNVSQTEAPVFITGESGTGKELVARAIHEASPRNKAPFVKVNCAALNENLLESELFGHMKGSYTGADRTRIGRFEIAHKGTIFLDEIGDIPPKTQVRLLRVLEEKQFERVGDNRPIRVDVRVVSATNRNLEKMIKEGVFREDLYFRINVFPLTCPALRQRPEDIPAIVQRFIEENRRKTGKNIIGLTPEAMNRMTAYNWPGNVRELRNAIEYAFVLCTGGEIAVEHLPPKIIGSSPEYPSTAMTSKELLIRQQLMEALRKTGGNQTKAAELLGVSRVTIWKRMQKFGLRLKHY